MGFMQALHQRRQRQLTFLRVEIVDVVPGCQQPRLCAIADLDSTLGKQIRRFLADSRVLYPADLYRGKIRVGHKFFDDRQNLISVPDMIDG